VLHDRNDKTPEFHLLETVRLAHAVQPELISQIIAESCPRLHRLNRNGKAVTRVEKLIQCAAWLELALFLVELELPGWVVRRVAYDEGEWQCSFSRYPNLPLEFDDTVDTHHEVLPLAILTSLLEIRIRRAKGAIKTSAVPQIRPAPGHVVCCDNFS
jgi:hypothetical protein